VWYALQQRIDDFLSSVTLADLLQDQARVRELVSLTASAPAPAPVA
jgi:DNA-binding IscR family transcriptional regulator